MVTARQIAIELLDKGADNEELKTLTASQLRKYIDEIIPSESLTDDDLTELIANEVVKRMGEGKVEEAASVPPVGQADSEETTTSSTRPLAEIVQIIIKHSPYEFPAYEFPWYPQDHQDVIRAELVAITPLTQAEVNLVKFYYSYPATQVLVSIACKIYEAARPDYRNELGEFHYEANTPQQYVITVLKRFDVAHPLVIPFIKDNLAVGSAAATKELRKQINLQSTPTLPDAVIAKVTFPSGEILRVAVLKSVTLKYEGRYSVTISVKQNRPNIPPAPPISPTTIARELATFNAQHPLNIPFLKKEVDASDPDLTQKLRLNLGIKLHHKYSELVLNHITFKGLVTAGKVSSVHGKYPDPAAAGVTPITTLFYVDENPQWTPIPHPILPAAHRFKFVNYDTKDGLLVSKRTRLDVLHQGVAQIIDSVMWEQSNMFVICPFEVVSGEGFNTETGRKGISSLVEDYSQLEIVIDGQDSLTAYWLDSYELAFKTEHKLELVKQLKVGRYYYAFIERESVDVEFGNLGEGNNLTAIQFVESFTCKIPYFGINKLFFAETVAGKQGETKLLTKISRQQRYLWVVPEVLETSFTGDGTPQSFQTVNKTYFMLSRIINVQRNPIDKTILWVVCEFVSVNAKKLKSGLAINNFIQNGAIGEPVAYPSINNKTHKLEVFAPFLKFLPATDRQMSVIDLSVYMGSIMAGFEVTEQMQLDIKTKQQVVYRRPTLLAYYNFNIPSTDVFSLNKSPEADFYLMPFNLRAVESFSALRDVINIVKGATVPGIQIQGFFQFGINTPLTNADSSVTKRMVPYWSESFLTTDITDGKTSATTQKGWVWGTSDQKSGTSSSNVITPNVWDVNGNDYFSFTTPELSDPTTPTRVICTGGRLIKAIDNQLFKFSDVKASSQNLPHFLFYNSILMKTVTKLPLTKKNNFSLDYRLISFFWKLIPRVVEFGLRPKWSEPKAGTGYPTFPAMLGLMPAGIFNNYKDMFQRSPVGNTIAGLGDKLFNKVGKFIGIDDKTVVEAPVREGVLPLDIFSDNANSVLFGARNTVTAFNGELTHLCETTAYSLITGDTTTKTVRLRLGDIGQVIWLKNSSSATNFTKPFVPLVDPATFRLLPRSAGGLTDYAGSDKFGKPTPSLLPTRVIGYMVTNKHDCILGGASIQDKFYYRSVNQQFVSDQDSIYYDMMMTRAAFTKNVRMIWNSKRTGNPLFNFKDHFSYPQAITPPEPDTSRDFVYPFADVHVEDNLKDIFTDWGSGYEDVTSQVVVPYKIERDNPVRASVRGSNLTHTLKTIESGFRGDLSIPLPTMAANQYVRKVTFRFSASIEFFHQAVISYTPYAPLPKYVVDGTNIAPVVLDKMTVRFASKAANTSTTEFVFKFPDPVELKNERPWDPYIVPPTWVSLHHINPEWTFTLDSEVNYTTGNFVLAKNIKITPQTGDSDTITFTAANPKHNPSPPGHGHTSFTMHFTTKLVSAKLVIRLSEGKMSVGS